MPSMSIEISHVGPVAQEDAGLAQTQSVHHALQAPLAEFRPVLAGVQLVADEKEPHVRRLIEHETRGLEEKHVVLLFLEAREHPHQRHAER
jgi:hypothetical protein